MIKLGRKVIENVVILKCYEGSYEELNQIKILGMRGLGGFTIQETLSYLLNTKDNGVVAYNFKDEFESKEFKRQLKKEIKRINNGEKGLFKLDYNFI